MSVVIAQIPTKQSQEGSFHWTVDSFYRAISADIFDDPKRIELVQGNLWEKEPMNPPHAFTTGRIARKLRAAMEPSFYVREEKPVRLSADTEPIPDVAVVLALPHEYATHHPGPKDIVLVVEIADATVARDTGEKALLYAQAGIADYWVSLVGIRELWVYRSPTQNGYEETLHLTENDTVSPLAAPNMVVPVRDLLAPSASASSDDNGEH